MQNVLNERPSGAFIANCRYGTEFSHSLLELCTTLSVRFPVHLHCQAMTGLGRKLSGGR